MKKYIITFIVIATGNFALAMTLSEESKMLQKYSDITDKGLSIPAIAKYMDWDKKDLRMEQLNALSRQGTGSSAYKNITAALYLKESSWFRARKNAYKEQLEKTFTYAPALGFFENLEDAVKEYKKQYE